MTSPSFFPVASLVPSNPSATRSTLCLGLGVAVGFGVGVGVGVATGVGTGVGSGMTGGGHLQQPPRNSKRMNNSNSIKEERVSKR
jgi:hypothetical protein